MKCNLARRRKLGPLQQTGIRTAREIRGPVFRYAGWKYMHSFPIEAQPNWRPIRIAAAPAFVSWISFC